MSRRERNETLKLTFPRKPPYQKVDDYLKSKSELQKILLPNYSDDKARTDPDVKLTTVRRIYTKTVEDLEKRRDFYKTERVKLDNQWKELEELQLVLRDNFKKLGGFISTNQDKRNRAIARRNEDLKLINQRTKNLENLQNKMTELDQAKIELDKEIVDHMMYQTYLNSVVTAAQLEFKHAEDLIHRYESLVETKKELGRRQNEALDELEHAKNKITKMADENAFHILGLNNIIATMNARYQNALRNAMHWERVVWCIKKYALLKFREITEVKQACSNVYFLMYRRKSETSKIPEHNFERQLIYIKKTLRELSKVRSEAELLTKRSFSSMKAEISKSS